MSSWHQHVFGTRLGPFWSLTKNNTTKLMNKTQMGKLQPIQLIFAEVLAAPGRCQHGLVGTGRSGCENSRIHPKLFPCPPNHTDHSAKEKSQHFTHTHIQLNMFKPLQRLISDFIFSSSAGRACSLPSIIHAFALMNY